jgi:hypothetical protein
MFVVSFSKCLWYADTCAKFLDHHVCDLLCVFTFLKQMFDHFLMCSAKVAHVRQQSTPFCQIIYYENLISLHEPCKYFDSFRHLQRPYDFEWVQDLWPPLIV